MEPPSVCFHLKAKTSTGRKQWEILEESLLQQGACDPSLEALPNVLSGMAPGLAHVLAGERPEIITKVAPLDCTVPLQLKTSKRKEGLFKLLPSSLRVCMHFGPLEFGDLPALICVLRLLICPITFPLSQSCLPVLDGVLGYAIKSPWLCP